MIILCPMKLSIVIPAYNEESTVGDVIGRILTVDLPGVEKGIIVVDDGSSDRTGRIARSRGATVVRHAINRGLGAALGTGIKAAILKDAAIIVTCDADGQHSPADMVRLIEPLMAGRADVVIGSRLSDSAGMPPSRRMANRFANLITRLVYGIRTTDSQSGLRAFSRSAAERIRITANHYEVSSEICGEVRRNRLKLTEIPVRAIYTDYSLAKGQGLRVGLKTMLRLLLSSVFGRRVR